MSYPPPYGQQNPQWTQAGQTPPAGQPAPAQAYPPVAQGYPTPPPQGYPTPPQGYPIPPQGYPTASQGWQPPPQGHWPAQVPPGGQPEWGPPQQGYGTPGQAYGRTVPGYGVPPAGYPSANPQYGEKPPYQTPATPYAQQPVPPPQPHNLMFKWEFTSHEKKKQNSLNAIIRDPWGQVAYTVTTPKHEDTTIKDAKGERVARIEWHSSPRMEYRGYQNGAEVKIKKWAPLIDDDEPKKGRVMSFRGELYDWSGDEDAFHAYPRDKAKKPPIALTAPGDLPQMEITPEGIALGLLEDSIVFTALLLSQQAWGDTYSGGGFNVGGVIGLMLAS